MNVFGIFLAVALTVSVALADGTARFESLEAGLNKQASAISIPRLEFKETTLADALEFLRSEARAHDPKHRGIAIEVDLKPYPMMKLLPRSKNPEPTPPGGWPIFYPLEQRINLSLRNISLAEALRQTAMLSNCKIVPSGKALRVVEPEMSVERLITHTIPLSNAPKAEISRIRANPKHYFGLSDRSSCYFEDEGMTLVVTDTLYYIDQVHAGLESLVSDRAAKKAK